jgi:glycosyltransferase involved in cell wall biosynthesis
VTITAGVVSTIITVFNRPLLVAEAIGSVLAQTYRPVEVIVVDDGSTDNTATVVRRIADAHPGVVRYVGKQNEGFARAVNTGLKLVAGEFVQFLDSDDVLLPEKFAEQVAGLRAHPECGISYCYAREYALGAAKPETPARRTGESFEQLFPAILGGRLWPSPVPLYRRAVIDAIGVYGEWAIHREWEYECRAAAMGVRLHRAPMFLTEVRGVHHLEGRIKGAVPAHKLPDYVAVLKGVYAHARSAAQPPSALEPLARRALSVAHLCDDAGALVEARRCRAIASQIAADRTMMTRWIDLGRRAPRALASRCRDLVPLLRGKNILRRYSAHYARARRAYPAEASPNRVEPRRIGVRTLPVADAEIVSRVSRSAARAFEHAAGRRFFPNEATPLTIELANPFELDGLHELCDPLLADLEQSVYGAYTIADKVYVYRTLVTTARPQKSWLWHYDNHPREVLKLMIYLTDVDDSHAPFEYIRNRTDKTPLYGSPIAPTFGTSRLAGEQIEQQLRSGWERCRVTGPRGTTILFDDNVVHRATMATAGHRDVIVFQVRPVPFSASKHIDPRWTGTFGDRQFHLDPNQLQPQRTA